MKKRVLILGGSEIQVPVIQKCKELGHETIVVDFNPVAAGLTMADVPLIISTNDKVAVLEKATEFKIDGILTTSDLPVRVVAFVASKLGLPALSLESALLTTNKFALRNKLKESRLSVPEYAVVTDDKSLERFDAFPYVVKPVDSSGSRGVKKVSDLQELRNWFPEAMSFSQSKEVIVESFIEGKEFSVEVIVQRGKIHVVAVTEKILFPDNEGFFVEDAHFIPAAISETEKEKIVSTTIKAIEVLGIDHAACHVEVKLHGDEITVIEVGARLGGDFIGSHLVRLATGVEMLECVINLSLGLPVKIAQNHKAYSAIQFLNNSNYQNALEYIQKNKISVEDYEIKPFNDGPLQNSFHRLGHVIFSFGDRKSLESAIHIINRGNRK